MLQIKEYDLVSLDRVIIKKINDIDSQIIEDLVKISKIDVFKVFFQKLDEAINWKKSFSFIIAPISILNKMKGIDTQIPISDIKLVKHRISLPKNFCKTKIDKNQLKLNDVLEHVFGYHKDTRTQILKMILRKIDINNCAYCLAQYTTSYIGKRNNKNNIYIKGTLDHVHPKSINALLSLSINNLVPVCGHCNQRKLDADKSKFDFNPFDSKDVPVFNFKNVITIDKGFIKFKDIGELKLDNVNATLEKRLDLTALYKEYRSPVINLLDRYNRFNSIFYGKKLDNLLSSGLSENLEYFISESPYSDDNIQSIPLHKFKSDFYKELENYKKNGGIKFL